MNVREFFWPILEAGGEAEDAERLRIDLNRIETDPIEGDLDTLIEEARLLAVSELERRRAVEARANTYLAIAGVLMPVLAAVTPATLGRDGDLFRTSVTLVLFIAAGAYLFQSGRWAFQCLEVGIASRLDAVDLLSRWAGPDRKVALIRGKFTCVRRDRARINFKVTCVKMAHTFAVRAFAVFLIAIGCRYAWEPAMAIVSAQPVPAVTADKASS
jgi:hypothetical protein